MRTLRRGSWPALIVLAAVLATGGRARGQVTPSSFDQGPTGLALALRHLLNDGSVLMITAHPDDENNALLVKLSRGLGINTSLLTLTRGDGGQNEIGPELFQAIGILRTEELAAVHRFDGVDQYFTRAYEFGYSFSDQETFEKWGREQILDDVVRVVRSVRPDVILTLARQGNGGGLHHEASAQLGHEAFHAAADPNRFPQHLEDGLMPWQTAKSYESGGGSGARGGRGGASGADVTARTPVLVETGDYDPLLGMSWNQLGALARASHLCQGTGQLASRPGPSQSSYRLVNGTPASASERDVLDGVDFSITRLSRFAQGQEAAVPFLAGDLDGIAGHARRALDAFDVRATQKTLPSIAAGLTSVRALIDKVEGSAISGNGRKEILWRLRRKEQDFVKALALAQGLVFHATVDDGNVVRGQTFNVTATVWNTGAEPVTIDDIPLSAGEGWTVNRTSGRGGTLQQNESLTMTYAVTVSRKARYSQPYWRIHPGVDRYDIEIPEDNTLPWSPPDVMAHVRYTSAGVRATLDRPAYFRYDGPWVGGEKQKVVNIVPALSVHVTPEVAIVPQAAGGKPREFRVTVLNNARTAGDATVRLEAPAGWIVQPGHAVLPFKLEEEELTAKFEVTPPARLAGGEQTIRAIAVRGGEEFREGYQVIAYNHIQERHLFHPAVSTVKAIDVSVPSEALVGYVMGSGDDVPAAIEQLGAKLTLLSADDLAFSDLSKFTTIVTGIRAYEKRPDLRAYNQRLLDFVRGGGHLVVQYNKVDANQLMMPATEGSAARRNAAAAQTNPFFPYPGLISRDRITVEEAPVRVLVPGAAELNAPNRITAKDFDGWVQERGLYFFDARDPRYVDLLASTDPWPNNPGEKKGMLTVAPVGLGTWTYVGLGLWRQLPAGTPGAYRILANLIGKPRATAAAVPAPPSRR